ncbi:MAG: PBECR4 domain-containing protein, partial [Sphaerochaeta sp.]|nr:PBECR4 domain-containing protein [Sphaerochaeta sp.]
MEQNELLHCYESYCHLVNYQYRFILGRKNKEYIVDIPFTWNEFVHLTGITHLKDLPELKVNQNLLRNRIEREQITLASLRESQFFKTTSTDIEYRIKYLGRIDEFFTSDTLAFDYLGISSPRSAIRADWMLTSTINH